MTFGYSKSFKNEREEDTISTNSRDDLVAISNLPIQAYPPRKNSLEAMEFFGVRTAVDERTGKPSEHYYPYVDQDKVCGYKVRKLPKDFRVVGKIKGLFGQHLTYGDNFVIAVEGEACALACYDMMRTLRPDQKPYNVVSLPTGASQDGSLHSIVKAELEWLSKWAKVVLCLDNDGPGVATANALADFLCASTDVRIATLPLKDSAAMWEAGREKEWAQAINNAKRFVSDQIVLGTDGGLEELLVPLETGMFFSFIPKTCDMLQGFRTRELTTLIAPPKCGKSSLLRHMQYEILHDTDESVGGIFLEEVVGKTKQSVIAFHTGVALNEFRKNPKIADRQLVQEAYDTLLPRLHLFQHKNRTITDDLLERKIDFLVKGLGCKTVILDHATFVTGTRQTNNERRDIDMMLTRLARSVEDNDYRLFVVAHINRKGREHSTLDKSQKYPYWELLSMSDARGSGAFEQLSHNMIGLEKEHLDPEGGNTRGRIRTRVMLSREWGVEGVGDYMRFNSQGRFEPIAPEDF